MSAQGHSPQKPEPDRVEAVEEKVADAIAQEVRQETVFWTEERRDAFALRVARAALGVLGGAGEREAGTDYSLANTRARNCERRIYVASSWRNERYPYVLAALEACGEVYDFRDPARAFDWRQVDPEWDGGPITSERYAALIEHPLAVEGFKADMGALMDSDVVVLVCPCGSSAHLEAGWAVGAGRKLYILSEQEQRPDLMYRMAELVTPHLHEIVAALFEPDSRAALAGGPETVCPECGKRYTHLRLGETCSACDFAVKVVREGERQEGSDG